MGRLWDLTQAVDKEQSQKSESSTHLSRIQPGSGLLATQRAVVEKMMNGTETMAEIANDDDNITNATADDRKRIDMLSLQTEMLKNILDRIPS